MNFQPEYGGRGHIFKTIDSHTAGEATRIIYDGYPAIPGKTMTEKKKYLEAHFDKYRHALMLEPRGHRNMFGALLTKPVHPEADFGVVFMDSGGYLNMCGHGSIGVASMAAETGLVSVKEPYTEIVLDAPAGMVRAKVRVENGRAAEVSIINVPSFLYAENLETQIPGFGTVRYDISFGGSFFVMVDADRLGPGIGLGSVKSLTELGMELLKKVNEETEIRHPYLDIASADLVEFYGRADDGRADIKNCIVFGQGQVDRSPCGTGTSAEMARLFAKGRLGLHEELVCESITGSLFRGEVVGETELGGTRAAVPQITGRAYITGMNTWIIDESDPIKNGFLL